jgi:hypothetical protein
MKPMEPMKPIMEPTSAWWPAELNDPTVSGSQDGARYAFFPDEKRLLINRDGTLETFDTGEHLITGAAQGGTGVGLTFTTSNGELDLETLRKV